MRNLVLGTLALSLVGCGINQPLQFPAHVASIENFDSNSASEVNSLIASLNQSLGQKAVVNDPNGPGSSITVRMVATLDPNSTTGANSTSGTTIAGRATLSGGNCLIEIAQFIAQGSLDLFQPVLWHEFGHCAGLVHTATPTQIMSPLTVDWSNYNSQAVTTYLDNFLQSAGLTGNAPTFQMNGNSSLSLNAGN
jgi:predicted small lipoprotein YifL